MCNEQYLSCERVFERFKCFPDKREDIENNSRPGRPSMSEMGNNNLIRFDIRLVRATIGIIRENISEKKDA